MKRLLAAISDEIAVSRTQDLKLLHYIRLGTRPWMRGT